jgi:hypothetical protein
MRELIDEKPEDVLNYIEEQGVLKVCEFEVQVRAEPRPGLQALRRASAPGARKERADLGSSWEGGIAMRSFPMHPDRPQ